MGINAFFRDVLRAPLRGIQWSWGAIDPWANRVFLRVWEDQIRTSVDGEWVQVLWKPVIASLGYPERVKHLTRIRQGAEAIAVVCTAVAPGAPGRRRIKRFDPGVLLRLGELREDNKGEYARVLARIPTTSLEKSGLDDDITEIVTTHAGDPTTMVALVNARVGQGKFRTAVLADWDHGCAVTGSLTLEAVRASHIKPWREASDAERLDPENGLPLVASLDALFDAGLISFDDEGKMLVAQHFTAAERAILGLAGRCLCRRPSRRTRQYLSYHRKKFVPLPLEVDGSYGD